MKSTLIIGGAGFIGLNIASKLSLDKDYDITIADNFFRGKKDNYFNEIIKRDNVQIIEGDFTKISEYTKLEKSFDQVYMLAGIVGVEYTSKMPTEVIRANSMLILNYLEWMKKSGSKKILYSSTSECYAGTIDIFKYKTPTDEKIPLCISDIYNSRYTYAITKILGESACIHYAKENKFSSTIIRYHNVYGPRMGFKHVIPQVIVRFINKENPFRIIGYNQTRAFNYLDDAVNGTISAMESEKANDEIFHIGDMNSEITIEELVKYIGELVDYKGEFLLVEAHPGSVMKRCPDINKAMSILNYKVLSNWKDGVKKTVKWYVEYINSGGKIYE